MNIETKEKDHCLCKRWKNKLKLYDYSFQTLGKECA
jgi:hypothetical protein